MKETASIRVLCVDDHPLVRQGISALIDECDDIDLVAEASTGREALERFRECRPDITLMDLKMAGMSGIDAITAIRAESPDARIIVLTTYRGDVAAQRALNGGACAYLLKNDVRTDLLDTVRAVHAGQRHINIDVARELETRAMSERLSAQEIKVLERIAGGHSNKAIGEHLHITEGTVKNHVKSILSKLHANDRTHAVMLGLERGIIGI